jgi:hypothetical protein
LRPRRSHRWTFRFKPRRSIHWASANAQGAGRTSPSAPEAGGGSGLLPQGRPRGRLSSVGNQHRWDCDNLSRSSRYIGIGIGSDPKWDRRSAWPMSSPNHRAQSGLLDHTKDSPLRQLPWQKEQRRGQTATRSSPMQSKNVYRSRDSACVRW